MTLVLDKEQFTMFPEIKVIDFKERPTCPSCKNPMIICSHSTPSRVIGFEGIYYTKYKEYTCGDEDCSRYRKKKFRAHNPWRIDRHKFDLKIESEVIQQRLNMKMTYSEIKKLMEIQFNIKMIEKTIGNIVSRHEIASKLENNLHLFEESRKNNGIFVGVDAIAPFKGEDKHVVAIDHYTDRTLLVERIQSENTDVHIEFQQKLKKLTSQNNINVLGFMSDDHVAQRKAIQLVWGPKMKHCRCLFHFQKRIMLEPFNLNRKLKTKMKARIRKITYVKQMREGNLTHVKNSAPWEYLHGLINDLVALQTWRNKRNDTSLEGIMFYERVSDIYLLLTDLKRNIPSSLEDTYKIEIKRLNVLLKEVKSILTTFKEHHEDLLRIKEYHSRLKDILEAHEEPSEIGLKRLIIFAKDLEARLKSGTISCDAEIFYIKQLCSFVFDRGESLLQYRDIKNANNTNNLQETKFKKMKHSVRRTQGIASAPRYLQHHAKYMLFVNPDASREEIRQTLMNADYKAIAKIMKEDRALRKRPLSRIKDEKKWKSRMKDFKEKLLEI